MELRDHPGMTYHGISNWPPVWTRARSNDIRTLRGEIGTLTYVYSNCDGSHKCYLIIDYEGEQYIGCLLFNDRAFCGEITRLLRIHLGRPIQQIGDLDVSHTL
jgi:hypothetical protein